MNLFAPSFLEVEAGLPYTFNTEISGTTGVADQKSLTILSAKKKDEPAIHTAIQSISMTSEEQNRVNFISINEDRVGTY